MGKAERRYGPGEHRAEGQRPQTGIVKAAGYLTPKFLSSTLEAALSHEKPWPKQCLPSMSISSIQGGDMGMEQGKEAPHHVPVPCIFLQG